MSRVEKKQPQYGSDVVVDLMKAFDIEYAAFNPGATFRGIHDSIVNYGGNYKPEVIFCHHEEISVAVAHGYAKAKNKPMIAICHNMVGLQHASMAIFNAYIDRVPMMVLGGTGPMNSKRRRPRIDWIHTALVQGNQAVFFGGCTGFLYPRLPDCDDGSDRAGVHQLRCRYSGRCSQERVRYT